MTAEQEKMPHKLKEIEVGLSKGRRRKNKASVVDAVAAQPLNPQAPLIIFEPNKGVTIANLPTA